MTILITGAAGFIGFHIARALLHRGEAVIGIDNFAPYYDPTLKRARFAQLTPLPGFTAVEADITDTNALALLFEHHRIDRVIHLAAQPGVRHSLVDPFSYTVANITGTLSVLEAIRHTAPDLRHLVYASSSSVYGNGEDGPFAEADAADRPLSLYGASKRSAELMSHAYAHLFGVPMTGLRFFTVYGPWGRPDMAVYLFADRILSGAPLTLYNGGELIRDFTYIDDIVAGVLAALDRPPKATGAAPPKALYNLGTDRPTPVLAMVAALETALGKRATIQHQAMQPGDPPWTHADIAAARRDLGYRPDTSLEEGIGRFVAWHRAYHGAAGADAGAA